MTDQIDISSQLGLDLVRATEAGRVGCRTLVRPGEPE